MIAGCTFPPAVNYNPAADAENYSCLYLFKANGQCHLFKDVIPEEIVDKSFTLSYSVKGNCWVFFHDYLPDFYIHTRENLYTLKDNVHFKHNSGPAGVYYNSADSPKPFFIDVIFAAGTDMLLESVGWISEFLNNAATDQTFSTLSHITIWNSTQHTGRITLSQIWEALGYHNIRKTKGQWNLDDFRDILMEAPGNFLQNIFHDYAIDSTKIDPAPVWYNQAPIQDKWFCVRFEFDNRQDAQIVLHDTTVEVLKQNR
jgi:hypothetical protein